MANVGIASLVVLSIGLMIAVVLRVAPGQDQRRTRALVGLVPGIIGAGVVAALTTDIIPDAFESFLLPWVIVGVTIVLIVVTVRNLSTY
jgi:hypothetical protein